MAKLITLAELRAHHRAHERDVVLAALERNNWSLTGAAAQLGVVKSSLMAALDKHQLLSRYNERKRPRGRPSKL